MSMKMKSIIQPHFSYHQWNFNKIHIDKKKFTEKMFAVFYL